MKDTLRDPPYSWVAPARTPGVDVIKEFFQRVVWNSANPNRPYGHFFVHGRQSRSAVASWAPGDTIDFVNQGTAASGATATFVAYNPNTYWLELKP